MKHKIFIIEDDSVIRTELKTLLAGNGYEVFCAANFERAEEEVKLRHPHLILLDIMLPAENGFTLCSRIRSFSDVPIIFVTGCNTDMDELHSILSGGDAFIKKPYNTAILLAKIARLLKKAYPEPPQELLSCQDSILHLDSSRLEYHGKQAELTKNEMKILFYLFKHAGSICARADIIEYLWDNQLYVDDNTLSVNIGRIREKLSSIGLHDFIKTRHRQGYIIEKTLQGDLS